MNWQKIAEDSMKVLVGMTLAAIGAAVGWNLRTTLMHERELATKDAQMKIMEHELAIARAADKELITMMAEEIKKLKEAVEATCAHMAAEPAKPEFPLPLQPQPEKPKKDPKKTFEKFFPPEQRTDDYQRILRDKFEQRTEQMQMKDR